MGLTYAHCEGLLLGLPSLQDKSMDGLAFEVEAIHQAGPHCAAVPIAPLRTGKALELQGSQDGVCVGVYRSVDRLSPSLAREVG